LTTPDPTDNLPITNIPTNNNNGTTPIIDLNN